MKHKRPPIPLIILLIIALMIGGYFGIKALAQKTEGVQTFSGTIEAVKVVAAPEIGGKLTDIFVEEGDQVSAGDPLFSMDPTLLQAQRDVAAANLELARSALANAQVQVEITNAAIQSDSAAARNLFWNLPDLAGYTLKGGAFTQQEMITAANSELENASRARDEALTSLTMLLNKGDSAEFKNAETQLLSARAELLDLESVLVKAKGSGNVDLTDAAQNFYEDASTRLKDAQSAYDDLKDTDAAKKIIEERAQYVVQEDRYQTAYDNLIKLQFGEESLRRKATLATLKQAETAVVQAEAQLALIDTQISKLKITAPVSGTVITRSIQPGAVIAQGASAIIISNLEDLTLTVYVPEDLYGSIKVGESAQVSVDSFPGMSFSASVLDIADEAEFTPRNVQTVEGRKSTVFAVKLKVDNIDGKLKPGMPADVIFSQPVTGN